MEGGSNNILETIRNKAILFSQYHLNLSKWELSLSVSTPIYSSFLSFKVALEFTLKSIFVSFVLKIASPYLFQIEPYSPLIQLSVKVLSTSIGRLHTRTTRFLVCVTFILKYFFYSQYWYNFFARDICWVKYNQKLF